MPGDLDPRGNTMRYIDWMDRFEGMSDAEIDEELAGLELDAELYLSGLREEFALSGGI
jgi:hypothetical protein